jgi:hypothetical protein
MLEIDEVRRLNPFTATGHVDGLSRHIIRPQILQTHPYGVHSHQTMQMVHTDLLVAGGFMFWPLS